MSSTKPRVRRQPASLDGNNLYAAEAILDKKTDESGKDVYLIKWVGWSHQWNTWEPEENITSESLLKEFEENLRNRLICKGSKRAFASTQSSTPDNLLKKRGRGRPSSAKNKSSDCPEKQKVKPKPKREEKLKNRPEKNSSENDSPKPSAITRRVSRSSSQEQESRSSSVDNCHRSPCASNTERKSRRSSFIDSSTVLPLICTSVHKELVETVPKSHEISTSTNDNYNKFEDAFGGRLDSSLDDATHQEDVSSDCEHSINSLISSPEIVPKTNIEYSDYESSSESNDSSCESNTNKSICDKYSYTNSDSLITNRANLEPHIVLERLPKFIIKRLTSRDSSSSQSTETSYQISIKSSEVTSDNTQTVVDDHLDKVDGQIKHEDAVENETTHVKVVASEIPAEEAHEITTANEITDRKVVKNEVTEVNAYQIEAEKIVENETKNELSEEKLAENNTNSLLTDEKDSEKFEFDTEPVISSNVEESIEDDVFVERATQSEEKTVVTDGYDDSNNEVVDHEIEMISEPVIGTNIEESIKDKSVVVEEAMDTDQIVFMDNNAVDSEPSIDLSGAIEHKQSNVEDPDNSIEVIETESEMVRSNCDVDLELTFNDDVMLDIQSNDDNLNNQNENNDNVSNDEPRYEMQYSPVSEEDIGCYSSNVCELEFESTQTSQNSSECHITGTEEVVQTVDSDLSICGSEVDPSIDISIEKADQFSNKSAEEILNISDENVNTSKDTLNTSEETLSASEVKNMNTSEECVNTSEQTLSATEVTKQDNEKVCETSPTEDKSKAIQESDYIEIVSEEEFYTDSQDSQLSEARSTPQSKTKWTPQSDYIEKSVEQPINYNIDLTSRIEIESDNSLLPAPPSITIAQALPHRSTLPLSSQSPSKSRLASVKTPLHIDVPKPQTNDKSNELQTTSAIIVDVILSPSADSNAVESHLSPNVQNNAENDKREEPKQSSIPPITASKISEPSIVMPYNLSPASRPSAPPPAPAPPSPSECSVADASSWPLLSQTNHPMHSPIRSPLIYNSKTGPTRPLSDSCFYRPVIQLPQRQSIVTNNPMRVPLPQMSSPHPQVIQRIPARQPNLPHTQLSPHPFIPRVNAFSEPVHRSPELMQRSPELMLRNPDLMPQNLRQTSAQHFSPSIRPEISSIRSLQQMRSEFVQTNRPLVPMTDVRMRPEMLMNVQTIGPQSRHPSYETFARDRPILRPLLHKPMPPISHQISPYGNRHMPYGGPHPPQFIAHLQQRLSGLPPNTSSHQIPYPYPERMPSIPQSNIPIAAHSTIRSPIESQKRVLVEPKQLDIREKLKQSQNMTENIGFNPRREVQECREIPSETYFQRIAYNDNMANKELEVEEILEGRLRRSDISNVNRSPVILSGNKSDSYKRSDNIDQMQILQRLLTQGPEQNDVYKQNLGNNQRRSNNYADERPAFGRITANQSEMQPETRSPATPSSATPKSGHKDILTEAMEEIQLCVVFDDDKNGYSDQTEENIQLTITDNSQTGQTSDNLTPEEGQVYYLYADENAGQLSSDELIELIKSQGLQVVESDALERQRNEDQMDSNKGNENDAQLNDDIVIEIDDKTLEEVQNQKSDESNSAIEVQLLVINDNGDNENKSNENSDLNGVQTNEDSSIISQVNNEGRADSEQNMGLSLVADESHKQLQSEPIPLQSESLPIQSESMSLQSEPIPLQSEPILLQSEPILLQSELIPSQSEPIPLQSEPIPLQSEPIPLQSQSQSSPIVQLTDKSTDNTNEALDNSELIEVQQKDNDSRCINQTETVESIASDAHSIAVVVEECVDSVVRKESEGIVETKDNHQLTPEPIQYVSMPTFCFNNENNGQKSKSTEDEDMVVEVVDEITDNESDDESKIDEHSEQQTEKQTTDKQNEEIIEKEVVREIMTNEQVEQTENELVDKQSGEVAEKEIMTDKQIEEVEKEIINRQNEEIVDKDSMINVLIENIESEDSVKETINEDELEESVITDQKTVSSEELVNKSVQHPVVSSSVEDFLPSSPLCSQISLDSDKSPAQQTVDVDVDNENFMPNSPLSSSESGVELPAPTTTIYISGTNSNDNNCPNSETISSKSTNQNQTQTAIEVPLNESSHQGQLKRKEINSSVNDENSGKKRKTKLEVSHVPPQKKMSEEEMEEFLHLLRSRKNGFDEGWTPKEIIGINSLNSTLVFLVKWTNDKQTIILSEVANHKCPQMVIQFYEKHINWDDDTD